MRGNILAGSSSYNTTAADSAVQPNATQLYKSPNQFSSISPNVFGVLSNTEKNSVLASTLAALTSSNSGGISPASALASVFGHDVLGGLNFSSSAFQLTKEQPQSMKPIHTKNSITSNEHIPITSPIERNDQKPKGGKIEDIIKRIRDKKNS